MKINMNTSRGKFLRPIIAGVMLAAVSFGAQAALQRANSNGVELHFIGAAVNSTCTINTGLMQNVHLMGEVNLNGVTPTSGDTLGTAKAFHLQLLNCQDAKEASVTFSGLTDSLLTNAFTAGTGSGAATGVALQLLDTDGTTKIDPGSPVGIGQTTTGQGMAHTFYAQYIQDGGSLGAGNLDTAVLMTVSFA